MTIDSSLPPRHQLHIVFSSLKAVGLISACQEIDAAILASEIHSTKQSKLHSIRCATNIHPHKVQPDVKLQYRHGLVSAVYEP